LAASDEERETLERWARRPTTAQALAQRAELRDRAEHDRWRRRWA
jgi:hypothetical protein